MNGDVTQLLEKYANGAERSLDQVVAIVYEELHGLARQQLRRSGVGRHVQTTVLVHEAYEKLVAGQTLRVHDRRHFFAIASRAMRQIVVDTYRAESAAKRGGGAVQLTMSVNDIVDIAEPERLMLLNQALEALADQNEDLAEVVDLTCFGGLTNEEIAELTDTTVRTVQRKVKRARAWLAHFMEID